MKENDRDAVLCLAALAGLPLTEERIAALALTLPQVRAMALSLSAVEYGQVEPACRFRPSRGPQR